MTPSDSSAAATLAPWMISTRYVSGQQAGHYESFYQRANHPTRPLAFWIRYTIFNPAGRPEAAIGELWAIFFDGETGHHTVAKEEHPIATCSFGRDHLAARIGDAELAPGRLVGSATGPAESISWDLTWTGEAEPMFLMPHASYRRSFPAAKSLVATPLARYDGRLEVAGRTIDVDGWVGSQNHNWGSRHTDAYAFGQVAGFDDHPDSFLEVVSARVKVGPVRLPMITCLSLRHGGSTYELVDPLRGLRTEADYGYFFWRFSHRDDRVLINGEFGAEPGAFVALNYYNPPGGTKQCLNTKIASCTLTVTDRLSGAVERLSTAHRALFEILTDHRGHGIDVRA
jgi:hypothetical protein